MPTIRQKRLAKEIIENLNRVIPKNKYELLESVSYSKSIAKQPSRILESKGVKEALKEEGITEDKADKVVLKILESPIVYEMVTPDNQLRAAQEIYKRLGSYAPEKRLNVAVDINQLIEQADKFEKTLSSSEVKKEDITPHQEGEVPKNEKVLNK